MAMDHISTTIVSLEFLTKILHSKNYLPWVNSFLQGEQDFV